MEFAFVGVLFFILLLGIISFGILLAFKQNMTQSASESARASIAVIDDSTTPAVDERKKVALASMEGAMGEFDRECFSTAFCLVEIHECGQEDAIDFATIRTWNRATMEQPGPVPVDPCLTARMEFENDGSSRILPPFPLISSFEPDFLSSQTTVRLVPVEQVTP